MKLDQLLLQGAGHVAKSMGHERIWKAGLSAITEVAIATAGVPSQDMSVDEIRDRMGLKQDHLKLIQAGAGIAREVLLRAKR